MKIGMRQYEDGGAGINFSMTMFGFMLGQQKAHL